ncbi:hypothetical protein [Amycolatopsis acididurans]|nr:hypothetical protein [Amycolatopsis acididurans]
MDPQDTEEAYGASAEDAYGSAGTAFEPAAAAPEPAFEDQYATESGRLSPRRKSRDAGTLKPFDYSEAESAVAYADTAEHGEERPRKRRNPFLLAGVLFGVALVLAGLAVWFKIEDNKLSAATSNTALLDVARTSQVNQAATSAVETLFSYDFNDIAKTQNAAKDLLNNDAVKAKYDSLMGEVQRLAPQQKMVVTVKVSRSAVIMLDGDRARVLLFVDQTSTRTDQNQTSSGSAQLYVNMQEVDGKWKLTDLGTYDDQVAKPSQAPAPASSAPPAGASTKPSR